MDILKAVAELEAEALRSIDWATPYQRHPSANRLIAGHEVAVCFEVKSLGSDHLRAQYWVGAFYTLRGRTLKKSFLIQGLQTAAPGTGGVGPAEGSALAKRRTFLAPTQAS